MKSAHLPNKRAPVLPLLQRLVSVDGDQAVCDQLILTRAGSGVAACHAGCLASHTCTTNHGVKSESTMPSDCRRAYSASNRRSGPSSQAHSPRTGGLRPLSDASWQQRAALATREQQCAFDFAPRPQGHGMRQGQSNPAEQVDE